MPPGAEVSPRRAIAQEANEAFWFIFLFFGFFLPPLPLISANFSSECDAKAGFSSFIGSWCWGRVGFFSLVKHARNFQDRPKASCEFILGSLLKKSKIMIVIFNGQKKALQNIARFPTPQVDVLTVLIQLLVLKA